MDKDFITVHFPAQVYMVNPSNAMATFVQSTIFFISKDLNPVMLVFIG